MATKTNNLGLSKAELTDAVRSTLTANNENFDKIDDQIARLKANQITGTASGTEIVVEDSAEMESKLKISGNSEQDSRSGKNLFDFENIAYISDKSRVSLEGSPDHFVISTTNTKLNIYDLVHWNLGLIDFDELYYEFTTNITTNDDIGGFYVSDDNFVTRTRVKNLKNPDTKGMVDLSSHRGKYLSFMIRANASDGVKMFFSSQTISNVIIAKTEAELSPYEPYGAMPSPDYPSEIRSVKSKSDNLFDGNISLLYPSASGEVAETSGFSRSAIVSVSGGETYTISKPESSILRIAEYDSDVLTVGKQGTLLYNSDVTNNRTQATVKTSANTKTLLLFILNSNYDSANETELANKIITMKNGIMINKGDKALPYQPYGYVPVEAKVEGKNLLDIYYAKPGYSISSSTGEFVTNLMNGCGENYIKVLPNTQYTITAKKTVEDLRLSEYGINFSHIKRTNTNKTNSHTIITTENTHYLRWSLNYNGSDTVTDEMLKSLELRLTFGENEAEYTPYVEPTIISLPLGDIELRSTPDGTRDTFERVDGVWNKVGDANRKIYDGNANELLTMHGTVDTYSETIRFNLVDLTNGKAISENKCLCSKFTMAYADNSDYEHARNGDKTNPTTFIFYINKDRIGNPTTNAEALSNMRTWLSNNPMEIIYALETPAYTPITDTALIQALDTLEQLILHKGYNRITVTSVNGVKAYLDLSYTKDINTVLNNIITKLGGL